jgi:cbb3-type cytochrome oxidase subunit 1
MADMIRELEMKAWALFLRTAVLAVLVGMGLGTVMGITQNFALTAVHAHVNLVGWASMFLFGLYYRLTPAADARLAVVQYWFATTGLVLFSGGLALILLYGNSLPLGLAWLVGVICTVVSMVIFAWNVFAHTASAQAPAVRESAPLTNAAGGVAL